MQTHDDVQDRALRLALVLPGLHRVARGAEVAFESIAYWLAERHGHEVTLIGSGQPRTEAPYRFQRANSVRRERFSGWPSLPMLRSSYMYEELTFLPALLRHYDPTDYDMTVTCSYPYTNWALRRKRTGSRPWHVFVTQNGDWPLQANHREFRFFACDGLVCTNPGYYEQHRRDWPTELIPNGVDPRLFHPGPSEKERFDLPDEAPVALMVSALTDSKRVEAGIRAASQVRGLHLVVAGDGPRRGQVEALGDSLMPGRFQLLQLPRQVMPALYRAADVFLHMSLDEPSANAYIEALATGLPIVTHDRRVTRWTLEDEAYLVDTTVPLQVVEAMHLALHEPHEHHVKSRRELVHRRFDWRAIADQYDAFFRMLTAQHVHTDVLEGQAG